MSHLETSRNRLHQATSPYLLQHANNPVDWYPWGEEALTHAKQSNKPILLSIGYSACHWCHVMAHESFEDSTTAREMNELYINIKVDREERPDLDKIYQSAHQLLAQRPGGWPLTLFLDPQDLTPFFAGTYFPDRARHGLPAFRDLLQKISSAYREHKEEIKQQNVSMREALAELNPTYGESVHTLDSTPMNLARQQLENSFDARYGGFGQAPKFPHPTSIEFLLRHWSHSLIAGQADKRALHLAIFTLERMALGGINDQLGGGFSRYSVDEQWMIPHFEKMLYDNGPLLSLYCDAWLATGTALFRNTAESIADWVIREMQSPQGGYYSSLDADSEGEEGMYYVWKREQVKELLDEAEYAAFAPLYGLDKDPNFEAQWHLHTTLDTGSLSERLGRNPDDIRALLTSAQSKLFQTRRQRIPPGRDDKILSSWNALMIKGMVRAGRLLERDDYLNSARRAMNYLRTRLWREGRLLATSKDDKAHLAAYLDDYAYLMDALLELLQSEWHSADLEWCISLAEVLLTHFQDRDSGGFFFTADDHETLIHRPKPLGDDSTPSGNGIASFALNRLGHLLGNSRYLDAAERTLQAAWHNIRQLPYAHCSLLQTLEEHLRPTEILILRGSGEEALKWQRRANSHYAPARICILIPDSVPESRLPEPLQAHRPEGKALAYLCRGTQCLAPIRDFSTLDLTLTESEVAVRPPSSA